MTFIRLELQDDCHLFIQHNDVLYRCQILEKMFLPNLSSLADKLTRHQGPSGKYPSSVSTSSPPSFAAVQYAYISNSVTASETADHSAAAAIGATVQSTAVIEGAPGPSVAANEAADPSAAAASGAPNPSVAAREAIDPLTAISGAAAHLAAASEAAGPSAAMGEAADPSAALSEAADPSPAVAGGAAGPSAAVSEAAGPSAALGEAADPSAAISEAADLSPAVASGAADQSAAVSEAAGPSAAVSEAAGPSAAMDEAADPSAAEGGVTAVGEAIPPIYCEKSVVCKPYTEEVPLLEIVGWPGKVDTVVLFVIVTGRRQWNSVIVAIKDCEIHLVQQKARTWPTKRKSYISMDEKVDQEISMSSSQLRRHTYVLTGSESTPLSNGKTLEEEYESDRGITIERSSAALDILEVLISMEKTVETLHKPKKSKLKDWY